MAQPSNSNKGRRNAKTRSNPQQALDRAERAAATADDILTGGAEPELVDREHLDSIVRTIARRVSATQTRLTGGNTLETMARLKQDSLLATPLTDVTTNSGHITVTDGGRTLKDALDTVEDGLLNELFANERGRLSDYQTFAQIADLITQASEAVQTYCDNIISPDDFTKRDVAVFYEGDDPNGTISRQVQERTQELIEKYKVDDRGEEAIVRSLIKGDYFVAVLNLRQELEGILHEQPTAVRSLIESTHLPAVTDTDMQALLELVRAELVEAGQSAALVDTADLRHNLATYFNELLVVHEDTAHLASKNYMSMALAQDLPAQRTARQKGGAPSVATSPSLAGSKVRGSVVKMIPPENVIKLYQDDILFGYYYVELSGEDAVDAARRGTMDQSAVVRSIDRNISLRAMGGQDTTMIRGKDALIGRIITKTLSAKLGSAKYLKDHEEVAADAYAILARARREARRAIFTYVASDQMVHFTPNGVSAYGESVLARVKFLAKLYLGAMTNAFMRNSIRRPERLVWYIDVGVDNDGGTAIQNFIRTIKQREVKFSNLKDITTTINQIGEFHDFYVPTYNGERPVEVETLNMGGASEVDSPFLEYLRKAIIGGMGVPAAFVGYSEEVAFARSLTMDNGRFLRRVVRHQKHYGRAMTQFVRLLWRNEYMELEELVGTAKTKPEKEKVVKPRDAETELYIEDTVVDVTKLFVRYPSPATLNMANLSDSINQGTPVADFIVEALGTGVEDNVKGELKRLVLEDIMPQIQWVKYAKMLDAAKLTADRAKMVEAPIETPAAAGGDEGMPIDDAATDDTGTDDAAEGTDTDTEEGDAAGGDAPPTDDVELPTAP